HPAARPGPRAVPAHLRPLLQQRRRAAGARVEPRQDPAALLHGAVRGHHTERPGTTMSEDALRKIALQVRNWGRWGPDDEIGTLNHITPARIAAASRLVTAGKVFALGIPLRREGPQSGTRARFNPIHTMFRDGGDQPRTPAQVLEMQGYGGSDDMIVMP